MKVSDLDNKTMIGDSAIEESRRLVERLRITLHSNEIGDTIGNASMISYQNSGG